MSLKNTKELTIIRTCVAVAWKVATVSVYCESELFCEVLNHVVILPNLHFVNWNEFKYFLDYREGLYHAGGWENTTLGLLISYQRTQSSPCLLPVCLGRRDGDLTGVPRLVGLLWLEWLVSSGVGVLRARGRDQTHTCFPSLSVSEDISSGLLSVMVIFLPFVHSWSL